VAALVITNNYALARAYDNDGKLLREFHGLRQPLHQLH